MYNYVITVIYIYSYHFGVIVFMFYPEAVVRRCSLKRYSYKSFKIHKKTPVPESLF